MLFFRCLNKVEFKDWDIVGKVGVGGQGDIYKVRRGDVTAVLKRVKLSKKKKRKRFLREIHVLRSMDHPNIIELIDDNLDEIGEKKYGYYVMPYARFGNLAQRVGEYKNDIDKSLKCFLKICAGVEHAHKKYPPIVHRDIVAENILFVDSVERPVISDFGICCYGAKSLKDAKEKNSKPEDIVPAPERIKGREDDAVIQTDIYFLGKLLYRMLAGGEKLPGFSYEADKYNLAKKYTDPRYERINEEIFAGSIVPDALQRFDSVGDMIEICASLIEEES